MAVEGHPEIGALYFSIIVSIKPGQYRVEMSSAQAKRGYKRLDPGDAEIG